MNFEKDYEYNEVPPTLISMDKSNSMIDERNSYGRYWVFGKYKKKYLFAIGPHWWVTVIGMGLLFMMGVGVLTIFWNLKHSIYVKFYFVVFFLMIFFYFITFLINPGIIPKNSISSIDQQSKKKLDCENCRISNYPKSEHCYDCDICIDGYDHHCVWTGKCIGKGNLIWFYLFVGSIPLFFAYTMILTVILSE